MDNEGGMGSNNAAIALARYYLRSLETAAKNEAEPWFIPTDDGTVINLEHVLPKQPEETGLSLTMKKSDSMAGDSVIWHLCGRATTVPYEVLRLRRRRPYTLILRTF